TRRRGARRARGRQRRKAHSRPARAGEGSRGLMVVLVRTGPRQLNRTLRRFPSYDAQFRRGQKASNVEGFMANVLVRQGGWGGVCDGKKALVLENVGDTKFLNLKTREIYEQPDEKTHEQGTDAPGRAFSSVGGRRSAMDQTDWHDQSEQRFLQKLAGHLEAEVNAGKAKSLILVAPPRA